MPMGLFTGLRVNFCNENDREHIRRDNVTEG